MTGDATALSAAYREVESTVDYLRASTEAPRDDDWISCADLLADPAGLRELIMESAPGRGTGDAQVAASLFVQGYAFRVPSVAVAAFALDRPRPSLAPASTAFRIRRHRPADVAYVDPEPSRGDLANELIGHLAGLIDAVRSEITVGERLLWGDAAASLAVIFRAVEGAVDDGDAVRERASRLFADAGDRLDGLGRFETVEGPATEGWFWARTNCCLWYQTSGGRMCDDCSLLDPAVRTARWRDQLAGASS